MGTQSADHRRKIRRESMAGSDGSGAVAIGYHGHYHGSGRRRAAIGRAPLSKTPGGDARRRLVGVRGRPPRGATSSMSQHDAAEVLQAHARTLCARRRFLSARCRHRAASRLQAAVRGRTIRLLYIDALQTRLVLREAQRMLAAARQSAPRLTFDAMGAPTMMQPAHGACGSSAVGSCLAEYLKQDSHSGTDSGTEPRACAVVQQASPLEGAAQLIRSADSAIMARHDGMTMFLPSSSAPPPLAATYAAFHAPPPAAALAAPLVTPHAATHASGSCRSALCGACMPPYYPSSPTMYAADQAAAESRMAAPCDPSPHPSPPLSLPPSLAPSLPPLPAPPPPPPSRRLMPNGLLLPPAASPQPPTTPPPRARRQPKPDSELDACRTAEHGTASHPQVHALGGWGSMGMQATDGACEGPPSPSTSRYNEWQRVWQLYSTVLPSPTHARGMPSHATPPAYAPSPPQSSSHRAPVPSVHLQSPQHSQYAHDLPSGLAAHLGAHAVSPALASAKSAPDLHRSMGGGTRARKTQGAALLRRRQWRTDDRPLRGAARGAESVTPWWLE